MTYRYRLAAVFLMGFFVDCINIFMPAIALPTIAAEFHVGVSAGAWVANAYMLGLTLAIPVSTWLAGRWARAGSWPDPCWRSRWRSGPAAWPARSAS